MKTMLCALSLVLVFSFAFPLAAQTNLPPVDNFALVTNLWYNGYKSNVLAIAEQRLAANSNDLAGLIIRMDYNSEFANEECYSNDITAVLSSAASITNAHFQMVLPLLVLDLTNQLAFLAAEYQLLSNEEKCQDKQKGFINGKPLEDEDILKALHDDGLF